MMYYLEKIVDVVNYLLYSCALLGGFIFFVGLLASFLTDGQLTISVAE